MTREASVGEALSVLHPPGTRPPPDKSVPPESWKDLNLDQVVKAALAGREEYDLAPFFYSPLQDEQAVRYRQEVARDLEDREVAEVVSTFAKWMRRSRSYMRGVDQVESPYHKQGWFLDAAESYCEAVLSLRAGLAGTALSSRGLIAVGEHVQRYAASAQFEAVHDEVRALRQGLADVQFSLLIRGNRVTVGHLEEEADLSALVEGAFARFREGAAQDFLARFKDERETNHVHAEVLERVARLYPDLFSRLERFCSRRRNFLDPTLVRFDREVQFYTSYLFLVRRLGASGTSFCYPEVSTTSKEVHVEGGADIALSLALARHAAPTVKNDIELAGSERILVVTGPNQGGKTTFARMFGQLHYLAGLGLPVPAEGAKLFLPDKVFTHFEREERLEDLQGKLNDELLRVRDMLAQATSRSVVVMNESFSSTALADSLFIGTKVLQQLSELGALCVYVTFVDELASLNACTVSVVAEVSPDDPDQRTFKVARKPANGRAYAAALAGKYGLRYDELRERIRR
jgi:DNA mismatch repair protein MutS